MGRKLSQKDQLVTKTTKAIKASKKRPGMAKLKLD